MQKSKPQFLPENKTKPKTRKYHKTHITHTLGEIGIHIGSSEIYTVHRCLFLLNFYFFLFSPLLSSDFMCSCSILSFADTLCNRFLRPLVVKYIFVRWLIFAHQNLLATKKKAALNAVVRCSFFCFRSFVVLLSICFACCASLPPQSRGRLACSAPFSSIVLCYCTKQQKAMWSEDDQSQNSILFRFIFNLVKVIHAASRMSLSKILIYLRSLFSQSYSVAE